MQDATVLLLGNRRDLAAVANVLTQQFPDLACLFHASAGDSLATLRTRPLKLILFSWRTSADRESFHAIISALREAGSKTPIVVVADCDDPTVMLNAVRAGAVDCLTRPLNLNRLAFLIASLTNVEPVSAQAKPRGDGAADRQAIFQSPAMRQMLESLQLAARSDSTILLTGETGTGKNHLASLVHELSPRRQRPLVTVDCGSSSEHLIESDLFGHVRGAFTGADRDHVGKLERVGVGTILLDEINSLPMPSQSRLLRALEERVFEKLGGERTQTFSGRVIALTNKALETEVAEKRFRSDLYYRLNVISFCVPPLREHKEDIEPLVEMFVPKLAAQHGRVITEVSDDALMQLTTYSWPGNVRELRNVLERAVALSDSSVIEARHLHLPQTEAVSVRVQLMEPATNGRRLAEVRQAAERRELQIVLERHGNNRTRAARHLHISRSALYKRLEKLGLS